MKTLFVTREYPPHIYGGAGVVVDQLSRALARRMGVEVRCFGPREPRADAIAVRGYTPWERVGGKDVRFAPVLETLSIGLAMARDPVDADLVHAHTWYADMAALWIGQLYRIPLVVTLHSLEPLRPWKADQLGSGYLVSVSNVTNDADGGRSGVIDITLDPPVGLRQQVAVLLNRLGGAGESFSFFDDRRDASGAPDVSNTLDIAFTGLHAGDYLVRVQVDGAESPLDIETDPGPDQGAYTAPRITVP